MATEKTSNDYREERKARIAKSAKKNSKKSHKISSRSLSKKTKSTLAIIVAVVAVVAITVVSCTNLGVFERMKKIDTVAGESYSAVEYEYYYRSMHNYYYSMSQQYDSYYGQGYGYYYTGFDYNKLPEDQEYPFEDYKLEDGSKASWKEYLEYAAAKSLQQYTALADMAAKDNFKVEQNVMDEAYEQIDQLKQDIKDQAAQAGSANVSFGKYLRSAYGKGMTEKIFMGIVERETIASEYSLAMGDEKADSYDLAQLEEVYKKDTSAYNCVDFRVFAITPETPELKEDASQAEKDAASKQAKEAAKTKADEMFGKITDEASFIALAGEYATAEQKEATDYSKPEATLMAYTEKATIEGSFSEDTIKWLFGTEAKVGEKKMFEFNGTYYLFFMVKTPYRDNTTLPVDVRHILYQFDEEAKDAAADKDKQKKLADSALASINEADDKLAKFIEICEKESKDTGSASNGGLIEYLGKGKYVKAFEAWSLDPARKEGDLGVIETEYGYHVMYFVQKHERPYWQISIAQTLASEELTKLVDETVASDAYKVADTATVNALSEKIYNAILKESYPNVAKAEPTTAAPVPTTAAAK